MQVRQFLFQQHMVVAGAGNIACAAGTGAALVERIVHGLDCCRVLAHAEIIVGAPNGDLTDFAIDMARRTGERPAFAFEICENPVVAAFTQPIEFAL